MNILQPRDLEILQFIGKFGYCQERHIARLCNLSSTQTARILKRLAEGNYLNKVKILADVSSYILLTKQSGQLLEVKQVANPSLNTLDHDTLLVDLYFYLQEKFNLNQSEIKTDKQIRKNLGVHEINDKLRIPDLLINDNIAIELELSEKSKSKLQEIINSYIIDNNTQQVCYFLRSKTLLKKIHDLTNNSCKFKFFLFDFNNINKNFVSMHEYTNNGFSLDRLANILDIPEVQIKRFGNFVF